MVASRSPHASFDTKADAPASKNAWLAFGSSRAVNMITFISGFTRVISRHASSESDVREVHIEHNHVRLESLRRLQQCAAVRDASHDLAVQCQQPADGFHHVRVVVRKQHAGSRGQLDLRSDYRFASDAMVAVRVLPSIGGEHHPRRRQRPRAASTYSLIT